LKQSNADSSHAQHSSTSLWSVVFGDDASWRTRRSGLHELGPVVLYASAVGFLSLLMPIAVQTLVNTVAFGTLLQPLIVLSLIVLIALGMSSVFSALSAWTVEVLERRFFLRWYLDVSSRMSRLARADENREELVNRLFEVYAAQKAIRSMLVGGLESMLTIAVGLTVLSLYHPALLAFAGLLTLALGFTLTVLGRGGFRLAGAESRAKYELVAWLEELGISHRMVASSARLVRMADARAKAYLQARSQHFVVVFRQRIALWTLQALSMASLLAAGGWLVMNGQLTLGQLVAAELIVSGIGISIAKLGVYVETAYDLVAAAGKLAHLRDGLRTVNDVEGGKVLGGRAWSVRLSESNGEHTAVPGSALVVEGDEHRRTELLHEILMESPARRGALAFEDVDLRDLSYETTRKRICYVGRQDVFSGTVFDNASAARTSLSDRDEVRRALERAGFTGDLDQPIDRTGAPLTSTELSRLGIARAALSDAALVVFDRTFDPFEPEEAMRLLANVAGPTRVVFTRRRDIAACFDNRLTLLSAAAPQEVA
jgi:ABC-type bacteriocin/lantibiotic exporter with double-glycine peptidase domain